MHVTNQALWVAFASKTAANRITALENRTTMHFKNRDHFHNENVCEISQTDAWICIRCRDRNCAEAVEIPSCTVLSVRCESLPEESTETHR